MAAVRLIPVSILVLALTGCAVLRVPRFMRVGSGYSQEELQVALDNFASHFHLLVTQAADTIHASTTDPGVRKRTLLWKIQIIPLVEEASVEPTPQEAFVSLLTLTVTMRRYLSEGPGSGALGGQHAVAVEVAQELEAELVEIGARFLGKKESARVREEVEQFVATRPITSADFPMQTLRRTLAGVETTNVFKNVVAVPLTPFRALEGVGNSAEEIRKFNITARTFVRSVERLPEQVRWQAELLLYDLEERESFSAALASLDAISHSADLASEAVAKLPGDVRSLLEDSDRSLERIQQVLASAQQIVGPLRETSEQIQQASASWASILRPQEDARERPPSRPFDIREWESAARELGATARQLEGLLQELRATSDAGLAETALAPLHAAVDRADVATRAWIDLAAWRLFQVIAAGFALALVYRLVASRISRG
jgi:hypothetical protein